MLITGKSPDSENVAAQSAPLPVSTNDVTLPIQLDDVPITSAIENLTRLLGVNCMFDPNIGYGMPGQDGKIQPEPNVTCRWNKISAREALLSILNKYGLQIIYDPKTRIARITKKNLNAH